MKARAFFGSSKLMLPGAVIGAAFSPGFCADLSSWRLVIDEEGNLFQDTRVWQCTKAAGIIEERRQEQLHIGSAAVRALLLQAEQLGFHSYQPRYDVQITDCPSQTICIRTGTTETEVYAYGAGGLAFEGHLEMQGFLKLWKAIHAYAPFPRKS